MIESVLADKDRELESKRCELEELNCELSAIEAQLEVCLAFVLLTLHYYSFLL